MHEDAWKEWWHQHGERELRCILMTAWDPVGVGDVPEAWDEYDGYALQVARRLYEAANADEAETAVAEYLTRTEIESMGTASGQTATRNGYVATALVAWYEWSYRHGGRPPTEWLEDG